MVYLLFYWHHFIPLLYHNMIAIHCGILSQCSIYYTTNVDVIHATIYNHNVRICIYKHKVQTYLILFDIYMYGNMILLADKHFFCYETRCVIADANTLGNVHMLTDKSTILWNRIHNTTPKIQYYWHTVHSSMQYNCISL